MKKTVLIFILLVSALVSVRSQEEMPDRRGKIFLIPEFWLSFGTSTYIEVAPLVGYHVMDRLVVGLGPHYIYQSMKATFHYQDSYQTHVYGFKGFARFALITNAEQFLPVNLFSDLFVHAEYEGMSLEKDIYYQQGDKGRFLYHGFLVGGGFNQRIGMYNSVSFMVLWDVNETSRSPYSNPIFRIGFNSYF
ncbi:MAG: hypothetical protein GY790_18350 [Bacteroidetes bacterium]|nr:hypothetical protein [Bacteroidota bacterium]